MPRYVQILPKYNAISLDDYLKVPMSIIQQRRELEKDYNDRLDQIATLEGMVGADSKYLQDIHGAIDYATDMLYNQNGTLGDITYTLNRARNAYRSMAPRITEGYNRWEEQRKARDAFRLAHAQNVMTPFGSVDDYIENKDASWYGIDLANVDKDLTQTAALISAKRKSDPHLSKSDYKGYLLQTQREGYTQEESNQFYQLAYSALNGNENAKSMLENSPEFSELWNGMIGYIEQTGVYDESNKFTEGDIRRTEEAALTAIIKGMTNNTKQSIMEDKAYWFALEEAAKDRRAKADAAAKKKEEEDKLLAQLLGRTTLGNMHSLPLTRELGLAQRPGYKVKGNAIVFDPKDFLEQFRSQQAWYKKDVRINGLNPFLKSTNGNLELITNYNDSDFKKVNDLIEKYNDKGLSNSEKQTLRALYRKITGASTTSDYTIDELISRMPQVGENEYSSIVSALTIDGQIDFSDFAYNNKSESMSDAFVRQYNVKLKESDESKGVVGITGYDVLGDETATQYIKNRYPKGVRKLGKLKYNQETGVYDAYDDSEDIIELDDKTVTNMKFLPGRNSIILTLKDEEGKETYGVVEASSFGAIKENLDAIKILENNKEILEAQMNAYIQQVDPNNLTDEQRAMLLQYNEALQQTNIKIATAYRDVDTHIKHEFFKKPGGVNPIGKTDF